MYITYIKKTGPLSLLLVCLLIQMVCHSVEAQRAKKNAIYYADSVFFEESFSAALPLYDKILEEYPLEEAVKYHRYVAYHLSDGRGTEMLPMFDYDHVKGPVDKFYDYWMGRIYYQRYEFDKAKEHFQKFLAIEDYKSKQIVTDVKNHLYRIKKAEPYYNKPDDYIVEQLQAPVNSKFSDISPAFFGGHDELLFASSRPNSAQPNKKEDKFLIYHSLKSGKQWQSPTLLERLGVFSKNNAMIEVVNNSGKLFMNSRDEGGLFFSEPTDDGWTYPRKFNSELSKSQIGSHFFISDDEASIYFAFRRPGYGFEIYETHYDLINNTWSTPAPVKGQVNSRKSEDYPFLSHDGKYLYFSSNRRSSMGGYDIYRSTLDETTGLWSEAENMGFPINTTDDDINFQLNDDDISGFFSSNRLHTNGDFDIYYFHKEGKVVAQGNVFDKATGDRVSDVKVDFQLVKYSDETFHSMTNEAGRYQTTLFENEEYVVQLSKEDRVFHEEKLKAKHKLFKKSFVKNFHVDFSSNQ